MTKINGQVRSPMHHTFASRRSRRAWCEHRISLTQKNPTAARWDFPADEVIWVRSRTRDRTGVPDDVREGGESCISWNSRGVHSPSPRKKIPPLRGGIFLRMRDLNPHKQIQSLSCCHYTNPHCFITVDIISRYFRLVKTIPSKSERKVYGAYIYNKLQSV